MLGVLRSRVEFVSICTWECMCLVKWYDSTHKPLRHTGNGTSWSLSNSFFFACLEKILQGKSVKTSRTFMLLVLAFLLKLSPCSSNWDLLLKHCPCYYNSFTKTQRRGSGNFSKGITQKQQTGILLINGKKRLKVITSLRHSAKQWVKKIKGIMKCKERACGY